MIAVPGKAIEFADEARKTNRASLNAGSTCPSSLVAAARWRHRRRARAIGSAGRRRSGGPGGDERGTTAAARRPPTIAPPAKAASRIAVDPLLPFCTYSRAVLEPNSAAFASGPRHGVERRQQGDRVSVSPPTRVGRLGQRPRVGPGGPGLTTPGMVTWYRPRRRRAASSRTPVRSRPARQQRRCGPWYSIRSAWVATTRARARHPGQVATHAASLRFGAEQRAGITRSGRS